MLLYVEQPFPYDLEADRIDVHAVSARKPLFMDESAHDWRFIRLGRELGWSGVALKTCKTQTGAILSLCWAKAHGMTLMVQDLSNPMLAQISHVLLAAHAGTIMGVESNGMQFYPEASASRSQGPPRPLPPPAGRARPHIGQRSGIWLSHRRDRAQVAVAGVLVVERNSFRWICEQARTGGEERPRNEFRATTRLARLRRRTEFIPLDLRAGANRRRGKATECIRCSDDRWVRFVSQRLSR